MMNLLITVMAIALAALLTVGGVHYFDGGTGTRIVVSRGFETQFEAIRVAMSTYRAANNGMSPPEGSDIEARIGGYLPGGHIPASTGAAREFTWRSVTVDGRRGVCLERVGETALDKPLIDATVTFARTQADRRIRNGVVDSVRLAANCVSAGVSSPTDMNYAATGGDGTSIAVIMLER